MIVVFTKCSLEQLRAKINNFPFNFNCFFIKPATKWVTGLWLILVIFG